MTEQTEGVKEGSASQSAESHISPSIEETIEAVAESNSIVAVSLLRIYDVLMCLYAEQDPEDAVKLLAEHKNGEIRGDLPWLDIPGEK